MALLDDLKIDPTSIHISDHVTSAVDLGEFNTDKYDLLHALANTAQAEKMRAPSPPKVTLDEPFQVFPCRNGFLVIPYMPQHKSPMGEFAETLVFKNPAELGEWIINTGTKQKLGVND